MNASDRHGRPGGARSSLDSREEADLVEIDRLLRALPRMEPSEDVVARTRAAVEARRAGRTWAWPVAGLVAAAVAVVGMATLTPSEGAPVPVAVAETQGGPGLIAGGYWVPAMGATGGKRDGNRSAVFDDELSERREPASDQQLAIEGPARSTFEASIGALPSDGSMELRLRSVTRPDVVDYRAAERATVTNALREAAEMSAVEAQAKLVATLAMPLSAGERALVSGFVEALSDVNGRVQVMWSMRLAVALREAAAGD